MKRVMCLLLVFTVSQVLRAQITKAQLEEMISKKIDVSLIVSLVEKDCVDFDIDAAATIELSRTIPTPVLQAAIACKKASGAPKAKVSDESITCQIYRDLIANPNLSRFPVVIAEINNGFVTVVTVKPTKWAQEQTSDLYQTFTYVEQHGKLSKKVTEAIRGFPGIKDVSWREYERASTEEVSKFREESFQRACSKKGIINVSTTPPGASVLVDEKVRGTSPVQLEEVVGSRVVRVYLEHYAAIKETVVVTEGKTVNAEFRLEKFPELSISSDVPGSSVKVNGEVKGVTPLTIFLPPGEHEVKVESHRRRPYLKAVTLSLGQSSSVTATLPEIPKDQYCYQISFPGSVKDSIKDLQKALTGQSYKLTVPLYQVVTSILERKLDSTHVIDGLRFGYEPRFGSRYENTPDGLMGRELGGLAFGETVSAVVSTSPGVVKVQDVSLSKKDSSIRVEVADGSGETNSVFFDFTSKLEFVNAENFSDAFCLAFSSFSDS